MESLFLTEALLVVMTVSFPLLLPQQLFLFSTVALCFGKVNSKTAFTSF